MGRYSSEREDVCEATRVEEPSNGAESIRSSATLIRASTRQPDKCCTITQRTLTLP
jgi:hypothetical protein